MRHSRLTKNFYLFIVVIVVVVVLFVFFFFCSFLASWQHFDDITVVSVVVSYGPYYSVATTTSFSFLPKFVVNQNNSLKSILIRCHSVANRISACFGLLQCRRFEFFFSLIQELTHFLVLFLNEVFEWNIVLNDLVNESIQRKSVRENEEKNKEVRADDSIV